MVRKKLSVGMVVVIVSWAVSGAFGAEPEGWEFEIAPYGWLAGLVGDVTVAGQKTEFDKSASDLFDALEFGGSLLAVAQYNRAVFYGQFDYFSLSTSALEVENQPAGGSLDTDLLIGKVGIGYQYGDRAGASTDVILGVQSLRMDNTLQVNGLGSSSYDADLFDPFLMVRWRTPIAPSKLDGLYFNLPVSAGAWLGDSDFVYDIAAELQYAFNTTFDVRAGYRMSGYKGEENNSELDVALAGWTIGLGFRF